MVAGSVGGGVGVEGGADGAEEEEEVVCFGGVCGVFPVDVETVEAEISEEPDGRGGEERAVLRSAGGSGESRGVRPPTDGEQGLELAVGLFEKEQLLRAAVDVVTNIIPRCSLSVG